MLDAVNFGSDFESLDELTDRGIGLNAEDSRDVVQLLIDRIEFANVLVVSKADLVDERRLGEFESMLRQLNPTAKIVRSSLKDAPLTELLNTGRFSEEWAAENGNWLAIPRGHETSETEEYGFGSFVYEARRPFHPKRLRETIEGELFDRVVRSKGVVWIATRHDTAGEWSQAGGLFSLHPAGTWAASLSRDEWPDDPEFHNNVAEVWEEPWGDRRIELVIIGQHLDDNQITDALNECLLTDEELEAGPAVWDAFEDPFDLWREVAGNPGPSTS